MRNYVKVLLLTIALYGMNGCKKDNVPNVNNVVYEETISGIKKNEPVLLTFSNSSNTALVKWVVTPSAGVTINTVGNNATIVFSIAGSYNVTATAGNVSAKYVVNVNDTSFIDYGTSFNMSASKLVNIQTAETVVFSVHNAKAGNQITWEVLSDSFFVVVDTINNTATISFYKGGFGVVTASDGTDAQRRTVWINDFVTTNPNQDTVSFILGEKLLLTPSIVTIGGSKQLVMQTSTTNKYHCPTDKILSFSVNREYMIDYSGVAISPQPCSPFAPATCINSFSNIPVGTHDFTVNFENKTFTGRLNVSNTGIYTFTWPDKSVINISPLEVQ